MLHLWKISKKNNQPVTTLTFTARHSVLSVLSKYVCSAQMLLLLISKVSKLCLYHLSLPQLTARRYYCMQESSS